MKDLTKHSLRAAVTIVLTGSAGAILAIAVWIFATTNGTRWLFSSVNSLSGISFSVQNIEGRLYDHLLLSGVRVTLPQQKILIDRVELRWQPLLLAAGTVAVQEITMDGVRIQDDAAPSSKPPSLVWPKIPHVAKLFDGTIERLKVTNVSYQSQQEKPVLVTGIDASLTWEDNLLYISHLTATSPYGEISGTASAGFGHPALTADLTIIPAHPIAEMDQFSLRLRPGNAGPEPLVDSFTIVGIAGELKVVELGGVVGMAHDALNLRKLNLARPGQRGMVAADGSLAFTSAASVLSLQLKVADLDLAPELNVPTDLSGTLMFSGTLESYRGNFTLANRADGWQAATVSADYTGTQEGITVAPLTARILDGSLTGNLNIGWHGGFGLRGTLNGKNLNPARIAPGWKGVANFKATGKLAKTSKGAISGDLSGTLLESRLHGQELTGEVRADFAGDNINIGRLALQGKGFDLLASGELNRRLDVSAQISDISRLIPGASGTFRTVGWLCRRDRHLSGAFYGAGSKLFYNETEIAVATLTARLDQGADYPFTVAASLRDVVHGAYSLAAVSVAANGTLPHHAVNATLQSGAGEARLKLSAGYKAKVWKGEISVLDVRDGTGPWNLAAPAAFTVGTRELFLSSITLTTAAAERLEVAADLTLNPLRGQLRAALSGIDMARFKSLLSNGTRLEGHISGKANGIMLPGNKFRADGTVELSGGMLHQNNGDGALHLAFKSANASWGWRAETLSGSFFLAMAEQGQTRANFQLPVPARFPVAVNQEGALQASLAGQLRDNGIISALFPGLIRKSSGELDADIAVGGTWKRPQIDGKIQLAKGEAYLPTAGIHLKEVQLAARMENNLIRISSFRAVSGPGHIEGTALLALADWKLIRYQGTIRGENFQTFFFPELRIVSTPELNFEGSRQNLVVRGELRLPELQYVAAPSHAVITPSSDVVVEGRVEPTEKSFPLALDIRIRLLLGERVFVKVSGIDARLGGSMELTINNLDRITSSGAINVVKGHYRTYGVNLEIVRGRLFFAGGAIDNPTLDFLALRTIGDIRAGVTVAGTLKNPITKLYSEPAMPDVDILAYIVLGHTLGNNGEQATLVSRAAGALFSSQQAGALQEQIINRFGLSVLEINGGVGGTTGSMGYKPLQVTAPGAIPVAQQPGTTETVFTVGKYITPKFYISYGKSLFTGGDLFLLRYDIFKQWQIETQTGTESGVDLFYKFEFK